MKTLRVYGSALAVVLAVGAARAQTAAPMPPPVAPTSLPTSPPAGAPTAGKVPPPVVPPFTGPKLVGAEAVVTVSAPTGFVDDAIVLDGDRFGYVLADATAKAELHVLTLSTQQEVIVDLAKLTLTPVALRFVGPARVLVIGKDADGRFSGGLVELAAVGKTKPAGTIVYKLAPATHLSVITRDGKPRIAAVRVTETATTPATRYEAELLALDTGKRIGSVHTLELESDANARLGFKVNHWSEGWTKATGLRSSVWDAKEGQQAPEAEATFDLVTGKLGSRVKIGDLFEQRRRFQMLATGGGTLDFVRWGWDNTSLQLWTGGKLRVLELDQPVTTYDKASLQAVVAPDGSAWIALKVDPVNAAAVARQKADPEYLDLFVVGGGGDTHAVRKTRVAAQGLRHRLGATTDRFFLLQRNQAFERGGRSLTVYRPQ